MTSGNDTNVRLPAASTSRLTMIDADHPRILNATTVAEALDAYLTGLRDGSIVSAPNRRYKPAAIEKYERIVEKTLKPALGHYKIAELQRHHVRQLVDRLQSEGRGTGTIHTTLDPLRAIYRVGIERGEVAIDPTAGAGSWLAKAA